MAQSGFTPIQLYYSTTPSSTPTAGNLVPGELAINTADGKLFYEDSGGVVQVIATKAGASGDVVGPASATDGNLAAFDGTTGKLIKQAATVTAAQGGTGQSTYTTGDLLYATGSTALSKLGIGTNGQILTSTGTAPQWSTLSGVAVTTFSAGTTGFTPSTATSGAVTLGGTLATTNGGTGLTSFTANGVVYASSSSALATGSALTFDGTNFTETTANGFSKFATNNATSSFNSGVGTYSVASATQSSRVAYLWLDADGGDFAGGDYSVVGKLGGGPALYGAYGTGAGHKFEIDGSEAMRLTSTGLGIGTSSPTQKLTVSGNGIVSGSFTVGQAGIGDSVFQVYSASYGGMRIGYNSTSVNYIDSGELYFRNAAGSATFATLDSSGNLGLGVTPTNVAGSRKLEVGGATNSSVVLSTNSSNAAARNWATAANFNAFGDYVFLQSNALGGDPITAGSTRMTLDASGNLGIGTSSPSARLHAAADSPTRGIVNITSATGSTGAQLQVTQSGIEDWALGQPAGVNAFAFWSGRNTGNDGVERMRLDSSGNLGIGTSSPSTKLEVSGSAAVARVSGTAGTVPQLSLSSAGVVNWTLRSNNDGASDFTIYQDATQRLKIDSSGNLGIGTSSPQSRLHSYSALGTAEIVQDAATAFRIIANNGTNYIQSGTALSSDSKAPLVFSSMFGVTEWMRLDTSGNLGLGVTPSAIGAGRYLQVLSTTSFGQQGNGSANVLCNAYESSTNAFSYVVSAAASRYNASVLGHQWFVSTGVPSAGSPISFTQAMTLDASGNLGVGTTGPSTRLHVEGGATTEVRVVSSGDLTSGGVSILRLGGSNSATSAYVGYGGTSSTIDLWNTLAGAITFGTNNTERARITSGGDLLVGTTSTNGRINSDVGSSTTLNAYDGLAPNSYTGIVYQSRSVTTAGTGWYHFVGQSGNGTAVTTNNILIFGNGNIQNTNNSYGAISDIKLKENISDAAPKLNDLMQVRVVNYNLKTQPDQKHIGVIAQELEQVFPGMVEESPDRDADGNDLGTTTKSVKYSVFVPMLIKALQEQQAIIDSLKARLDAANL